MHYLVIISPWKRVGPYIWINFTQRCFVLSIVEIGRQVLERKILKFVNVFSLFHYYLPLEKGRALHLKKHELPSPKDTLCQVWLKLAHFFWRRFFFKLVNIFSLLVIISRWKRAGPFIWTNLNSLHPRILVPSLVEICPAVLEKILKILSMCFCYFVIISPRKRAWPFIWTNLSPLHIRMLCAKLGWNGFGEED